MLNQGWTIIFEIAGMQVFLASITLHIPWDYESPQVGSTMLRENGSGNLQLHAEARGEEAFDYNYERSRLKTEKEREREITSWIIDKSSTARKTTQA